MNLGELVALINPHLTSIIFQHTGLKKFAQIRAKFEGWLKVELIRILEEAGYEALPEVSGIDITFENVAIELKTCNTNLRITGVVNKGKPITKNLNEIISDINKLRTNGNYVHKYIVFIIFPIPQQHPNFSQYLSVINPTGMPMAVHDLCFANNVPAKISYIQVQ